MAELGSSLDVHKALDFIQRRTPVPDSIKAALHMPQHRTLRKATKLSLLQETPEEKTRRQLNEARLILNKMYLANQEELDIIVWDCRVFLDDLAGLLDENTKLRLQMATAAANAKRLQLTAAGEISVGEKEHKDGTDALAVVERSCLETLTEARAQEAIMQNDYEVGMMIVNATEEKCIASPASTPTGPVVKTTLLQCEGADGQTEMDLPEVNTQFTSKEAKESMQRALRMSLEPKDEHDHLAVEDDSEEFLELSVEVMRTKQTGTPVASPSALVQQDPATAIEEVTPVPVPVSTAHAAAPTAPDRPKCSTETTDCGRLFDQISDMVDEVKDALMDKRDFIAHKEKECHDDRTRIQGEIDKAQSDIDNGNIKLADGVATETANMNSLDQKNEEYQSLDEQYVAKKASCDEEMMGIVNTLCGIKVVRAEVYKNEGFNIIVSDCEVGDWVDKECTVTCGGGTQYVSRTIIQSPSGDELEGWGAQLGAACPPVQKEQACMDGPLELCPIDCQVGEWGDMGQCTNACNTGVQTKNRAVETEPENGGLSCPDLQKAQFCNTGPCDKNCDLGPWSQWGTGLEPSQWGKCSKMCDGGIEWRRRPVMADAIGKGTCQHEDSSDRYEQRACNEEACPPNLVCNSKIDAVFILDSSGSVGWRGFIKTKMFAHTLVSRMEMGEDKAKVGVIRFSTPFGNRGEPSLDVMTSPPMTFDRVATMQAIDDMPYRPGYTPTGPAMLKAVDVMTNEGRSDVAKHNSVYFLLTDGKATGKRAAVTGAKKVREKGRLIVVPVGTGMGTKGLDAMKGWASHPSEENCIQVKNYKQLPAMVSALVADICPKLSCRETFVEADGSDYMGCQDTTRTGTECQKWTMQVPHAHKWKKVRGRWPNQYAKVLPSLIGGHNYCRNPDGSETIWCYTMGTERWEYCDPRAANATGW